MDLGMEPFLITATLEAVVAQRLVRRICVNCKTEYRPTEEQVMELALRPEDIGDRVFFYGKGCDYCNGTGYRGRMGIYEIMALDDTIRELIMRRGSTAIIRREAVKRGMRTLREAGLLAIFEGITSLDEVVRETILEE
jgi:type IV pilus assembly protein PilB